MTQQLSLFSIDEALGPATTPEEVRRRATLALCQECGDDMHNDLDWLTWSEMGYGWCRACSAAVGEA